MSGIHGPVGTDIKLRQADKFLHIYTSNVSCDSLRC